MAGMDRSEQENLFRQSREVMFRRPLSAERLCAEDGNQDVLLSVMKSPVAGHSSYKRDLERPGSSEEDLQDYEEQIYVHADSNARNDDTYRGDKNKFKFFQHFCSPTTVSRNDALLTRVATPAKLRRSPLPVDRSRRLNYEEIELEEAEAGIEEVTNQGTVATRNPSGYPDPYYPVFLPIDVDFKAKYVFHHKKGRTFKERVYVFLEHPAGWLCFVYHFSV
jgi:hypothetical protein